MEKQLTADDFVTEYWPLGGTCNYVWKPEQVVNPSLANVEGYKAYILYGEYAWVHAVVIAKDYDEAVVTAAEHNLLQDYAITSEKELEDYREEDGDGNVSYPDVDMLDGKDYGYDISGLRFLELDPKELLSKNPLS